MKDRFVADTMAVVLRLEKRKMPAHTRLIFERAERGEVEIIIPAMVMAEIGYLSERRKIELTLPELATYCINYPTVIIRPDSAKTIESAFEIDDIPELHDRIIAGTAYELAIPLISNDPRIESSAFVTTIWR